MKKIRQKRILELLQQRRIETQEELASLLKDEGFEVTQATVSRDIKELRLVKVLGENGDYYYERNEKSAAESRSNYNIMTDSIISTENAMNIVVVKCVIGRASAVCATIDAMEGTKIVGTIAGDDTIFIVLRNEEDAVLLRDEINEFVAR